MKLMKKLFWVKLTSQNHFPLQSRTRNTYKKNWFHAFENGAMITAFEKCEQ
jgi:hypothetical protein